MATALLAMTCGLATSCDRARDAVWLRDYPVARRIAEASDRLLILHFSLPGRPLSDAMDSARRSLIETPLDPPPVLCELRAEDSPELCRELAGGGVGLATCFLHPRHGVLAVLRGHASANDLAEMHERASRAIGALATPPTGSADQLRHGQSLYELGSTHRAEHLFEQVLSDSSTSSAADRAHAHDWLARLAMDAGDLSEARRHLDEADQLTARPTAVRHLATALLEFGSRRPGAALRAIARGQHADPSPETNHHLAWLLGCTYHELGRDTESIDTLVSLSETGPRHWRARARQQLEHMAQEPHTHDH